jgi:DnaJ like chaperone protein
MDFNKYAQLIFFSCIAAVLGWFLGDLFGAAASLFLVREIIKKSWLREQNTKPIDSYKISLLKLSSLLIAADGKVHTREVKFVREYFLKTFGAGEANMAFRMVKSTELSNDLGVLAADIRENLEKENYYSIIMYLYSIAASDGRIDKKEDDFIKEVAFALDVSHILESIRNQFVNTRSNQPSSKTQKAMSILGLEGKPTKNEIKSAYRKLAKEFHPDKLSGMGDGIKNLAKEKFQEIQNAYEYLSENYE